MAKILVKGKYEASPSNVSDGNDVDLHLTPKGYVIAVNADGSAISGGGGSAGTSFAILGSGSTVIKDDTAFGDGITSGALTVASRIYNGSSYDRTRGIDGSQSVTQNGSSIFLGTNSAIPKFAVITASSSGTTQLVAAVASKKIRVLNYVLVSNGSVNAKFQSRAGSSTDKTGLLYLAANTGVSSGHTPYGHFETVAGEALDINLSGATAVGGHLSYIEV